MSASSAALSIPSRAADAAKHTPREIADRQRPVRPVALHLVETPSPSRPEIYGSEAEMAAETITRNRGTPRILVERHIGTAVEKAIPPYVATAKAVALKLGVSPRTVENIRQQVPDAWVTMGMVGLEYPAFAVSMADLWGIDIDSQRGYALFLSMQREMIERLK